MKKIIIIGSGIGGLASAALLAKEGYQVTVLEKNADLGGRCSQLKVNGFTFDLGPSWYLMPDIFEAFYREMGTTVQAELQLARLNPGYRIFFADGEILDVEGYEQIKKYFEKLEPGAGLAFEKYMKLSAYQYEVAVNEFLPKSYDRPSDFLNWRMATEGRKLHVFESMDHYINRYFTHPKIKKILEYSLVFLGSSPFKTPALYNIMNHVDFNLGVWYPQGGLFELTRSIAGLAKKYGAEIQTGAEVKKIECKNGKATGVLLENQIRIEADLIISNADYAHTELSLLEEKDRTYPKKYWDKKIYSPSAFILYLGVKKKFAEVRHHNLYFCEDWKQNFDDIFINRVISKDPSTYVCVPSYTDDSVAPAGYENVFLLTPIPPDIEVDINQMTEKSLNQLENHFGMKGIRENLVYSKSFTVKDFENRYNSYKGSALGLAHNLMQTAYFRPKQKSRKVDNLYYVGAGTHPGIGVPMCLVSAQVLKKTIVKNHE